MDRSFLSNEDVIAASRDFVCIRLATYEDAEEAKYLRTIFTRRGDLENTVFAILAPDGKTELVRSGRGPKFRSPAQMAERMQHLVSANYRNAQKRRWSDRQLPAMKSLELALNVASCDGLPALVAIGKTEAELNELREQLVPLAWNEQLGGQFVVATVDSSADLRPIRGLDDVDSEGVYLLEPDQFGLSGRVIAKIDAGHESAEGQLKSALADFKPPVKNHRQHVQAGYQLGLRWETAIPVTDKQAVQASSRLWGKD